MQELVVVVVTAQAGWKAMSSASIVWKKGPRRTMLAAVNLRQLT